MVHPELPYVKAKLEAEIWILSKAHAAPVIQNLLEHTQNVREEFPSAAI